MTKASAAQIGQEQFWVIFHALSSYNKYKKHPQNETSETKKQNETKTKRNRQVKTPMQDAQSTPFG